MLADSVARRAYLQEGWRTGREVEDTITTFFNQLVRRRGWDWASLSLLIAHQMRYLLICCFDTVLLG